MITWSISDFRAGKWKTGLRGEAGEPSQTAQEEQDWHQPVHTEERILIFGKDKGVLQIDFLWKFQPTSYACCIELRKHFLNNIVKCKSISSAR